MKVNLIVLNYNGRDLLERFLPSVVNAVKISNYMPAITLLDNLSTDDSVEFVNKYFPQIKIYKAKQNKVLCSFNELAKNIDDDIIILLNNDLRLEGNFLDPMIDNFKNDNNIFFVAARGYSIDGKNYEGDHSIPLLRRGIIEPSINYGDKDALINQKGYTFSAGVAAFDRKKFLELDGYDELYLPGRYEDVDLCFRAWKKGYIGIYEPKSTHYHQGGASFKKNYTSKQTYTLVFRNSILFTLKNISDISLLFNFTIFTLLRIIYFLITGKWFLIAGFFQAIKKLPIVIKQRNKARKQFILSDKEVLLKIRENFIL